MSPSCLSFLQVFLQFLSSSSSSRFPSLSVPLRQSVSYLLLCLHLVQQGSLAVEEASRRAVLPEEQKRSQGDHNQHQKEDGDHHGQGIGPALRIRLFATLLGVLVVAAHPVFEHRLGVAGLHLQVLVVKLPVLVGFVEIGVSCGNRARNGHRNSLSVNNGAAI